MRIPSVENLKAILGELDAGTIAAIRASGASLRDVTVAKALVDGKADIAGPGEQPIPGPVKQVMTILSAEPH